MRKAVFGIAFVLFLVVSAASFAKSKPKHVYMKMDGTVVKTKPTTGFFVEGTADGAGIRPTSGVQGGRDADLCTTGSPQFFLELSDGHIFQPQEGRLPLPPYVHGCGGNFVPSNREVVCFVGLPQ
jgi:hypothetical protein